MRISRLHMDSVDSTMDVARREAPNFDFLLVTANHQIRGRGTRGRTWESPPNNVHLTVALRRTLFPDSRIALLPLEAGLKLWETVALFLPPMARTDLRLKWPNDLMWMGKKSAGLLLEMSGEFLFVGAGVNVVQAPEIQDGGTSTACLVGAGADPDCGPALAETFFSGWIDGPGPDPESILREWRTKALWNTWYRLRDREGNPEVQPLDINRNGHLKVRFEDGRTEWLIADYLV